MSRSEEFIGVKDPIGDGLYNMYITDEPIVRCRDCRYSDKTYWTCAHFRAYEGTCDEYDLDVEPDGFCKWGVKRND